MLGCSNAGKPSAPGIRPQAVPGGGCFCKCRVTISTGQPAEPGFALVRVYGWQHNSDCQRRSAMVKYRSPEAVARLEEIVRQNMGRTNIEIVTLYQKDFAKAEMAEKGLTYEQVLDHWTANAATAPRDAAISTQVP